MDSTSVWLSNPGKTYPPLDRELEIDVLIVGAGITGLTSAYLLKQEGLKVAVVDRGTIGGGETGHTTAHLTQVTDKRLSTLVDLFGRDHAQAVWDAGQFAVDQIFAIADTCGMACHLQRAPGYQFVASGKDLSAEADALHREAHLIEELGFDCDFLESVPLVNRPGICFPNQAQFHPIEYLRALASHVDGGGSFVFENSPATEFESSPHSATVNGHKIRFERTVLATHVPIQGTSPTLAAMLRQTKLAAYSTYAIGGVLPKDLYPHALFWDTADPYLYIRIFPLETHDVVIIGGEDHKTGQGDPEASYKRLRQKAESVLPKAVWKWRWSGQVIETPDGLPYIGEAQSHEFLATGFAGNGMTFGTLAAMMARDWALELRNPWIDLFSVNRKKLATAWDYLAENKDYPFYLAKGSLDSAERAEPESVAPGEGRVVRSQGKKVAVHRDSDGHLHVHSAICPHLGCVVKWNAAEKTWDCPCHGSRFQATGEVIAGPAESPLAPVAEPAATHA